MPAYEIVDHTFDVVVVQYLSEPWNWILMAAFAAVSIYHMYLGLQVVIDDYVHTMSVKLSLLLLVRFVSILILSTCLFSLIKIASV